MSDDEAVQQHIRDASKQLPPVETWVVRSFGAPLRAEKQRAEQEGQG